ncbi:MAG TPA: DUF1287 domain-containing protein [Thermoanaerobaculia bacterium]|nr:DUF1287 domain-containing protein [Thermoanaerobaculia bacterium]
MDRGLTISLTRRILAAVTLALLPLPLFAQPAAARVVEGARTQVGKTLSYDPAYRRLAYPGGDVPLATGVCTDVVIRAYRHGGVDLQRLVHEDMKRAFSASPKNWGLRKPDPNIDHRRVPNLATFFRRKGAALPVTKRAADYKPGDVVTWKLSSGVPHIGVVSDRKALLSNRHLVIHNIGSGAQEEDVLFAYEITGHYRWIGAR